MRRIVRQSIIGAAVAVSLVGMAAPVYVGGEGAGTDSSPGLVDQVRIDIG